GGIVDTVTGGGGQRRGVSVEVGQIEAAVDLILEVQYGKSIPAVAESVRSNVIRQIENLVGLRVTEVNIVVDDIYFEGEATQPSGEGEESIVRDQERVH
ncbi:MAG TPA: Asp23/Gls24 family envelope stress response protein, partial [Thermoleophilia bacterium]